MFYCEKCHSISKEEKCATCGFNKLKQVEDNDFCFLAILEETFGKMIIECFKNEHIEHVVIPFGNGIRSKAALTLGNYKLFVPYNQFKQASEVLNFFTDNYSTDKLRENILANTDKWHFKTERVEKKIRKKLKLAVDDDLLGYIKTIVEQAQTINDVGLMTNGEHGLVVKNGKIVLWFSSYSFAINI